MWSSKDDSISERVKISSEMMRDTMKRADEDMYNTKIRLKNGAEIR